MRCSAIVPVHNHAALTRSCLDALLDEPASRDLEIVVVDDGSTDSTRALLEGYGDAIRVCRRERSGGFADACREGAAAAEAPLLLFLNNDTVGERGWLEVLLADADAHPEAAAIGAKLLYPDGTVQHAGVAIGQDRLPRHIYAGFPADHPAVNRSRRFQAVTGACMLVRRQAWESLDGFDRGYVNGLEDTDFCLRLGEQGEVVRFCHESVLVHLESPTRGRRSPAIEAGVARFRERWAEVRPDDLEYFVADGLLRLDYDSTHPIRLTIDPLLASVEDRTAALEGLLVRRAAQVNELLREAVRLSVGLAGVEDLQGPQPDPPAGEGELDHEDLLRRAHGIEAAIADLQAELAAALPDCQLARLGPGPQLRYRRLVERIRGVVHESVPAGATVMVVSRGDEELVELDGRPAWHFPQGPQGRYSGYHPKDSAEAISHLEELRERGGEYLLVPRTAFWWFEHYDAFAEHLASRYAALESDDACRLFALSGGER
jgi:GT2 family glycosyltransferase